MITFAIHDYESVNPVGGWGPLQAEFEKRGFPCRIFRSTRQRIYRSTPGQQTKRTNQGRVTYTIEATKTPNQDRAKFIVANCYDNAAMESFFATLTKECTDRARFQTRQEARSAIFEYLECFYNPIRLHSTLQFSSPVAFEQANESQMS